ncbi:protein-tyrosine kinase 6-like isoform X2 [Sinocyclocheilus rhinocerous]|uniref:protein-tyrosine kinase 6-like isoform X2 n=1 Tax=Sinocyclocheilus rhinocerous TaxID=307959 RepID=UPI0007B7920F|nr:PREDICTED: protein-tyrosine kinase 6-like isoform X2 [Sinocyclocheilus rhinocerous]
MGECLRKTCPCLKTLWDRIYGPSPTDGENSVKTDSDCTGDGLGNMKSDRYGHPASAPLRPRKPAAALYTALWNFEARDGQELSFKAGDMLEIVSSSGDWWSAKKIDSQGRAATGFVPFNYLARAESVESQPWFFGKLSRVEALSHLMSAENDNGSFLVRISATDSMGFVLSVKSQAKAKHFKIYHTSGQFYVDPSPQFASVLEVVEYYQTHPLSTSDLLRKPCIRVRLSFRKMPRVLPPPSVDEWELPKEQFTLEKMLGGGHFADVYSGRWKNHTKVAIKILKNNDALVQKDFQLEVQIMKHFRHRHLISLFAVCTSSAPFYIITELIEKGDLLKFLKNPEGRALDMESLIDMAAQVADGMAYLEKHNSIHRDLAARNVLVGEGYVCKIADFGLARVIKEPVYISDDKKIPYKWTAPEAIGHGRYSGKSDVWSFGILLYEIVTYGAVPYPGVRNCDVYNFVTRDNYRMPSPPHCPQVIYNIMRSCWKAEPEDRPTFKILRHELENYQGN